MDVDAWVVDPKGEYGPLARAWGVTPVALRPGGSVRLNPLDTEEALDGTGDPAAGGGKQASALTAEEGAAAAAGGTWHDSRRGLRWMAMAETGWTAAGCRNRTPPCAAGSC